MLHYLVMASLFVLAGVYLWWIHHRVVDQVVRGLEDAQEWRKALLRAGWIMILILLVNAQAFVKMNLLVWEIGNGEAGTWVKLLTTHLSVLCGTGSLMWLVVLSLREPAVFEEPRPQLGTFRAMVVVTEKLLPRFWWAALGLGTVFGFAAGPGLVIFLAIELTLFWVAGRISLIIQRRQLLQQQHNGNNK
ncbi:hypothetical protein ACFL27_10010 [candidate division CSSED10-310 bacterium]|uniref:Uncharacterized protein n=1 Tax=candidate division CSSED10-310 bacterium TaxID=2855610 RepID=A0ABV6YWT3_UNCC1